jgi:hypothetical protein
MGREADSDFVPFQINYIITSESIEGYFPLQIDTKNCSERYDVSTHWLNLMVF